MDQVHAVKRLWAELHVDVELVERHGEAALREAEGEMAKRLKDMAHPLGVELALERSHFVVTWERRDDPPWSAVGRMQWNPQTKEAELRGGHLDGRRYAIQRIGEPLRTPRLAGTPWISVDDQRDEAALVEIADTYEIAGWREDAGVWVYEIR
jgi:hypothetical protein